MEKNNKPKIVRVVTASYVVPWHLHNTLRRMTRDFSVTVIGQDVSSNRANYPDVQWLDINLNRKMSLFADLHSVWTLCRYFRRHRPDIVHSIMPKAGVLTAVAAFLCRVPVRVHTFTGQIWVARGPVAAFFLLRLDKIINALNTTCMTDSPSQSKFLLQQGIAHEGRALPVLGAGSLSGVEVNGDGARWPRNEDAREKFGRDAGMGLGLAHGDFVFAFIARKSREKGALDMLHAFARVAAANPRAKLLFVGPDESSGELATLRRNTPALFNNVIDIDRVSNHQVYLGIADVLCLPSYREGFGSIVIDAAAAGVPAIGSRIVGLVDAIDDDNTGMLVDVGNQDQLIQAMQALMANPQRVVQMGLAARQRVEALFSADRLYGLLRDFYRDALSK